MRIQVRKWFITRSLLRRRKVGHQREKKNQDVRREAKIDSGTMSMKKDVVNAERQKHDELRNPELERELKKRIRTRRDGSDDKDKYHDDGRDASRVSSWGDQTRSSSYKDVKQQDDRYGESHHEDLGKDKQKDDRHRESYYEDLLKDKQKDNRYRESHHDDMGKDKYRGSRYEESRKDHTKRDDKR
ncbi:hypothetical protein C5167_006233 [Papaver somniferum]|uniref:Uncharacterized protein n=1 Tax=Papaver somniferum TaxID=3469 RepID=A0A4Y7JGP1_PAPSO|nr:hypothetical protein C5167_006233 [Papaver somniferum]